MKVISAKNGLGKISTRVEISVWVMLEIGRFIMLFITNLTWRGGDGAFLPFMFFFLVCGVCVCVSGQNAAVNQI